MSYGSQAYWWVTCDWPGCLSKSPGADSETSAWGSKNQAEELAYENDGWLLGTGDDEHFCRAHPECHEEDLPTAGIDPPLDRSTLVIDEDNNARFVRVFATPPRAMPPDSLSAWLESEETP